MRGCEKLLRFRDTDLLSPLQAFILVMAMATAFQTAFTKASYSPPTIEVPHDGWRYAFPLCLPAIAISIILLVVFTIVLPAMFGIDVRFHYLDVVVVLLSPIITVSVTGLVASRYYRYEVEENIITPDMLGIEEPKDGIPKQTESTFISAVVTGANTIVMCTILLAYPLFVMPVFRSSFTNDTVRLCIVCFVHPLLAEFVSSYQRHGKGFLYYNYRKNANYIHLPMSLLIVPGFLEAIFIFYRRFMIQVIVDHRIMIVAITLTGFEEAILRTTMTSRDAVSLSQARAIFAYFGNSQRYCSHLPTGRARTIVLPLPHGYGTGGRGGRKMDEETLGSFGDVHLLLRARRHHLHPRLLHPLPPSSFCCQHWVWV